MTHCHRSSCSCNSRHCKATTCSSRAVRARVRAFFSRPSSLKCRHSADKGPASCCPPQAQPLSSSKAGQSTAFVNGNDQAGGGGGGEGHKCPPCPACARCPEPAFECKKVPNYSQSNIQIRIPRISVVDDGRGARHNGHISRRLRQKPNNPIMMMDILLASHEIMDNAFTSAVSGFVAARVFQVWLGQVFSTFKPAETQLG